MKLTDRKLTKIFFSSEIRIGPDNPKLETGTSQSVTNWPSSTPNKRDQEHQPRVRFNITGQRANTPESEHVSQNVGHGAGGVSR